MNRYMLSIALMANALCILNASSDSVIEIKNDVDFEKIVLKAERPVVVDFYAEWCGPCKQMKVPFENAARKIKDCLFAKVDIDKCQKTAQTHGIRSIPAFGIFKSEKLHGSFMGACSEDKLIATINDILAEKKPQEGTTVVFPDHMQMIMAISSENIEQIKALLAKGFDINYKMQLSIPSGKHRGKTTELTPIMIAMNTGNKEMLTVMLEAGALLDIKVKNVDGVEYSVIECMKKNIEDAIALNNEMIKFVTDYKK